MSLLTPNNFKALFPVFKDKPDEVIQLRIDIAKQSISSDIFKSTYEEAVLNIVAHEFSYNAMIESGDEFAGKELTSYSGGGLSLSFKPSSTSNEDNDYNSTSYGRKFLALKARLPISFTMGF
jgi:hypothetical protein